MNTEQSTIKDSKGNGGIVRLTRQKSALIRLNVIRHIEEHFSAAIKSRPGVVAADDNTHDESRPTSKKRDGQQVIDLLSHLQEAMIKPSDIHQHPTELILSQSPKESPQKFLLRAPDIPYIRQRVIFASKETEDEHQYQPEFKQYAYLCSLITRIQSGNKRQDTRTILSDKNERDETLIYSLNQMVLRENERLAKKLKQELAEIRQLVTNPYKPTQQQQHTTNKTNREKKPGCPQCQQT
ncbi:unnamed protein product [Mytilus coruscus]|uniref:Uncharacterized protein n=1 Tax=Mytilus coruscus TaxID=42192 RepID=A0A6J7ZZP7_MYTCO|nr:unnamed protein product [Mytilus coruscus]